MLWEDLKHLRPPNLKFLPVTVVPQVGRRGQIILDLSFPVYQEVNGVVTAVQASVNDTTVLTAPSVPVKEIGKAPPAAALHVRHAGGAAHPLLKAQHQ